MAVIEGARQRSRVPVAEGIPAGNGLDIARARYDFAVEGGAIGVINLSTDQLPSGAVILGGYVDVITPPTGASATVSVGTEAAADMVAAAAVSGAPWSTAGRKSVIPAFTGASSVKTTAARNISITVAAGALTAGVFDVVLFYLPATQA